jgi:hypothetical protein
MLLHPPPVEEVHRTGGVLGNRYSFTMTEGKPPKTNTKKLH